MTDHKEMRTRFEKLFTEENGYFPNWVHVDEEYTDSVANECYVWFCRGNTNNYLSCMPHDDDPFAGGYFKEAALQTPASEGDEVERVARALSNLLINERLNNVLVADLANAALAAMNHPIKQEVVGEDEIAKILWPFTKYMSFQVFDETQHNIDKERSLGAARALSQGYRITKKVGV